MLNTIETSVSLSPGTPVYRRGLAGCIASVKPAANRSFIIGANMKACNLTVVLVWDDLTISETDEHMAGEYAEAAQRAGLPHVHDFETREAAAREHKEAQRNAAQVKRDADNEARAAFVADAERRMPAGAKAVLVAELMQDESDSMTDYFNSRCVRTIILGFSTHTRDLFPEMRLFARKHAETAHLADLPERAEHREKYSMGGGFFLKEGGRHSNGWQVRKLKLYSDGAKGIPSGEWAAEPAPAAMLAAAPEGAQAFRIEEHTHTKKGFQMWIAILSDRVERAEFDRLRARAETLGGWYSRPWGVTPGGFAFKQQDSAEAFAKPEAGSVTAEAPAPRAAVATVAQPNAAAKLRDLADKMQGDVDAAFRDRLSNTPKRQRQADAARIEGRRLLRTQKALRALADHHDAGTVPPVLKHLASRKAVFDLMRSKIIDSGGYYDAGNDTGEPATPTPEALALWALVAGNAEAERAAEDLRRKVDALKFARIPGYFPTPAALVAQMIEAAGIPTDHGVQILEPSAGSGAILDALRTAFPLSALYAYEQHCSLREVLKLKGYDLLGADFMEWTTGHRFDFVLMNPPFENGQDMEHVQRAHSRLAPGGRLVAIMSQGAFFRSDRKASAFRDWFEQMGGERTGIPAGAFKESGTGVASVLVVINSNLEA